MPFAESTMWKDIERHFLDGRTLVWINPRTVKRYIGLIPDVVIVPKPWLYHNNLEMTAVEVKRTIDENNFSKALGQCVRFRQFATKIYLAAHEPIPLRVMEELSVVAAEIGVLSINSVGGVKVLREPKPLTQSKPLIMWMYFDLLQKTRRWGPSVGRSKKSKFRCLFCGELFDPQKLKKCPKCTSPLDIMLESIERYNWNRPF